MTLNDKVFPTPVEVIKDIRTYSDEPREFWSIIMPDRFDHAFAHGFQSKASAKKVLKTLK